MSDRLDIDKPHDPTPVGWKLADRAAAAIDRPKHWVYQGIEVDTEWRPHATGTHPRTYACAVYRSSNGGARRTISVHTRTANVIATLALLHKALLDPATHVPWRRR